MINRFHKYTLYQGEKELGLVFSDNESDILERWSEFKSVQDGKEMPVWHLKYLDYRPGVYSKWEADNANK